MSETSQKQSIRPRALETRLGIVVLGIILGYAARLLFGAPVDDNQNRLEFQHPPPGGGDQIHMPFAQPDETDDWLDLPIIPLDRR